MEKREVRKRARDPGQHGQGPVRRAEQQPAARSGQVRQGHHGVHRRRAQSARSSSPAPGASSRPSSPTRTPRCSAKRAPSRKFAQDLFLKGEVDQVDVLFTNFISTLTQKPEVLPLLPVGEIKGVSAPACRASETTEQLMQRRDGVPLRAGARTTVLGALLPHYLNFQVYQMLLEAKASEHSARMVAMKNATDNAKQLIKDLTLEYNKLRQANITKELLEITSAAMALG